MSYTSRIAWETLRTLDSATLAGAYLAVGTPLIHASYILKLVNNSTVLVTVSVDGATDIDVAPAGSFWLYDEGKYIPGVGLCPAMPAGTQIYVKGSVGTGLIYLVSQYLVVS